MCTWIIDKSCIGKHWWPAQPAFFAVHGFVAWLCSISFRKWGRQLQRSPPTFKQIRVPFLEFFQTRNLQHGSVLNESRLSPGPNHHPSAIRAAYPLIVDDWNPYNVHPPQLKFALVSRISFLHPQKHQLSQWFAPTLLLFGGGHLAEMNLKLKLPVENCPTYYLVNNPGDRKTPIRGLIYLYRGTF